MQCRTYWTLAFAGVILALNGGWRSTQAADLFTNTNPLPVSDCPQPVSNCVPTFTLKFTTNIDEIQTYHRQGGPAAGKSITLKSITTGTTIGIFSATARPASAGFEDWIATVGQIVPPDTYEVLDSQADMWQQNARSGNKGFTIVRGAPTSGVTVGGGTTESITDCTATCSGVPVPRPIYACSAHGPNSRCSAAQASGDLPGGGVTCTDGKNVTTCSCQNGCTTR
jgi:hypothetical protein